MVKLIHILTFKVLLTGDGEETDSDAVGAAVTTITYNMPDLVKSIQILSSLMEEDGGNGKELMHLTQQLCEAFTDLFAAAEPNKPRQDTFTAAREVGQSSHRILYTIEEEDEGETQRQDMLSDLVQNIAGLCAALAKISKEIETPGYYFEGNFYHSIFQTNLY